MHKTMLVTSTDLMMIQFLIPHVKYLSENGWKIEVACSQVGGRMEEVRKALSGTAQVHEVRLYRNPAKPGNLRGYQDLRKLIQSNSWDVIWTNEPVMGVMTRLAARSARRNGTKVVYMVHGFHFYAGAPKRNWMIYYPIERIMSRFSDLIVTINREDYERAGRMHAKDVKYIHGIGVDTGRLHSEQVSGGSAGSTEGEICGGAGRKSDERKGIDIRKEIGVGEDAFIVLSVGELLPRKNQEVIIRALGILQDDNIHYLLCGKGDRLAFLQDLAAREKVATQVHFLGYRKNVLDYYSQADIFAFPSRREGLGLAGLEAMYCGLPVVSSNINGLRDYMKDGKTGYTFAPDDAQGFARGIRTLKENVALREECGAYNQKNVMPFCMEQVKNEIADIFEEFRTCQNI